MVLNFQKLTLKKGKISLNGIIELTGKDDIRFKGEMGIDFSVVGTDLKFGEFSLNIGLRSGVNATLYNNDSDGFSSGVDFAGIDCSIDGTLKFNKNFGVNLHDRKKLWNKDAFTVKDLFLKDWIVRAQLNFGDKKIATRLNLSKFFGYQ